MPKLTITVIEQQQYSKNKPSLLVGLIFTIDNIKKID